MKNLRSAAVAAIGLVVCVGMIVLWANWSPGERPPKEQEPARSEQSAPSQTTHREDQATATSAQSEPANQEGGASAAMAPYAGASPTAIGAPPLAAPPVPNRTVAAGSVAVTVVDSSVHDPRSQLGSTRSGAPAAQRVQGETEQIEEITFGTGVVLPAALASGVQPETSAQAEAMDKIAETFLDAVTDGATAEPSAPSSPAVDPFERARWVANEQYRSIFGFQKADKDERDAFVEAKGQ